MGPVDFILLLADRLLAAYRWCRYDTQMGMAFSIGSNMPAANDLFRHYERERKCKVKVRNRGRLVFAGQVVSAVPDVGGTELSVDHKPLGRDAGSSSMDGVYGGNVDWRFGTPRHPSNPDWLGHRPDPVTAGGAGAIKRN